MSEINTSDNAMCAAALLYQKDDKSKCVISSKVRSCLIPYTEGDDGYDLKAKAERYYASDDELSKELEGHNLVAWHFSWLADSENAKDLLEK